ncbi:uncharacterized protein TNCV_3650861 [Trichonephila clavipes]|uniref:Pre-C2HC domain-containing protein n=1 Tax=Trichonephila clavipes TaxID=2585209 RepID=A0A8X6VCI9_TRICX|nr:uncharacterized protein TNCV_3650861 [Trichonephila clavipes]
MEPMETDPPDITKSCEERNRLSLEIEALDIVINRCTELVNFPDTDDNHEVKAILRASIDDTQRKKDTLVTPTNANNAKNKKRKINKKDSVEDFVFPKKASRPVSPLPSEPVTVNNSFSDLESENDKDQVAPEENNETAPPKPKPPPPIHLKIKKNIRDQLKSINQKFPDITNKSSGEFIKLITNDVEEYHALTNFLEEDKDFEFFSLKPKPIKPIKIVIKGLPIFTKTHEIQSDLEEEGFTIENVSQLISKKTKTALPFFQVTLPRNANNQKIFDLKTVGYMQAKIEGYLIRGITQCFNCINFFHTAENCHLKPKCLKCGKEHPTRQCPIKERQENPFCINCQEYVHSACYTKCSKFPKPKKGTPLTANKTFESNVRREGVSFANIVSGTAPPPPQSTS